MFNKLTNANQLGTNARVFKKNGGDQYVYITYNGVWTGLR